MRLSVRPRPELSLRLVFHGPWRTHRTPRRPGCSTSALPLSPVNPIPGASHLLLRRRENSSRGPPRLHEGHSRHRCNLGGGSGILTRFPFEERGRVPWGTALRLRVSPASQDRLTHVQRLFTWNPPPLQSSSFSLEYLLLPPRSALWTAPQGVTPMLCGKIHTPSYSEGKTQSPQGSCMGGVLQRHPFSGPIHSAGDFLHTP